MKITKKEYIEMQWLFFCTNSFDACSTPHESFEASKFCADSFLKFHNIQVEDENEEKTKN